MIESYLTNRGMDRFGIPRNHKYNTNIHWLCEEWLSCRCYICGNGICFKWYKNWNLKKCSYCSPIKINHRFYRYFNVPQINERDVKGFTSRELRKKLIFHFEVDVDRLYPLRIYHMSDVVQITNHRYGFDTYDKYLKVVNERQRRINRTIRKHNIEVFGITHPLIYNYKFPKSKSGHYIRLTLDDTNIKDKIIRSIARYDVCQDYLDNNLKIYNDIRQYFIDRDTITEEVNYKIMTYLRLKVGFIFIFRVPDILESEQLDYSVFNNDNCFQYFRRYQINIDKAINNILNIIYYSLNSIILLSLSSTFLLRVCIS